MTIKYSFSTQGFYDDQITYPNLPSDLVEITSEKHRELLEGQTEGLRIISDKAGYPILVNPQDLLSSKERLAQAKQLKQKEIELARDQALAKGIEYQNQHFSTDLATQAKLLTAQQMANLSQENYPVLDVKGNVQILAVEQMTELLKIVASHYRQVTQHMEELCKALAQTKTLEAISAITIMFKF